jgi:hypothetical protein
VTQTANPTTANPTAEPLTEGGSTNAKKATVPVSRTVVRSADKTVAPVLNTAAKTARKAAAPVLQTVSKTRTGTVAPAVEAATQSTGKTVDNTAAPVLHGVTQTIGNTTAPVLRTATQTVGATTSPIGKVASSTVAGAPLRQSTVAPAFAVAPPASRTGATPSAPLSNAQAGNPAGSCFQPGVCLAPAGPTMEKLVENRGAPTGSLSRVSVAWLIQIGIGTEFTIATLTSGAAGNGLQMAAPSASIDRIPPATPGPLPDGSSGAMGSAAGMAFSIFLTLAGLLLMGGLAAMRLLRLASEPWRAAPLVLIPERPG